MTTFIKSADSRILDTLSSMDIAFEKNVSLSSFSYFKSGGFAKLIAFPSSQAQLVDCVRLLNQQSVNYKIIGETSNLIFLDDKQYTCLVSTTRLQELYLDQQTQQLVCDCGVMLPALARKALYESVTGFEGLEGIPGSVGAAVFMNAGAYGYEMKKVLVAVDAILPDGSVVRYGVDELEMSHRNSIFRTQKRNEVIARCYFKVTKGDQQRSYSIMELLHAKRHKYQEFMYPNLGSLFSGSVYRALGEKDFIYKMISGAFYLFGYKWKILRRESPINRKWLNDITVKRFGIQYRAQPFSDKTMNSLVNNGHHTDEILEYINQIETLIGKKIPIENEIVEEF